MTEVQTVINVNKALSDKDASLLVKALQNPVVKLYTVYPEAAHLYLEELSNMRDEKGSDLEFEEIDAALQGNQFMPMTV